MDWWTGLSSCTGQAGTPASPLVDPSGQIDTNAMFDPWISCDDLDLGTILHHHNHHQHHHHNHNQVTNNNNSNNHTPSATASNPSPITSPHHTMGTGGQSMNCDLLGGDQLHPNVQLNHYHVNHTDNDNNNNNNNITNTSENLQQQQAIVGQAGATSSLSACSLNVNGVASSKQNIFNIITSSSAAATGGPSSSASSSSLMGNNLILGHNNSVANQRHHLQQHPHHHHQQQQPSQIIFSSSNSLASSTTSPLSSIESSPMNTINVAHCYLSSPQSSSSSSSSTSSTSASQACILLEQKINLKPQTASVLQRNYQANSQQQQQPQRYPAFEDTSQFQQQQQQLQQHFLPQCNATLDDVGVDSKVGNIDDQLIGRQDKILSDDYQHQGRDQQLASGNSELCHQQSQVQQTPPANGGVTHQPAVGQHIGRLVTASKTKQSKTNSNNNSNKHNNNNNNNKTPTSGQQPKVRRCRHITDYVLAEEEKRLLIKEGYTDFPMTCQSRPLTKVEERILRKIRRKIRNKKSAQCSRQRKKEYVEDLERKYAAVIRENEELKRLINRVQQQQQQQQQQQSSNSPNHLVHVHEQAIELDWKDLFPSSLKMAQQQQQHQQQRQQSY